MLPGEIDDLCNHFHRKYSGLRLRKLRFSRRRSNGVCTLAVNGHQSPDFPNPADKKEVSVSKRPTLTTFPTSSSSSSSSSPGPRDQHLDIDKTAGKSIADDEAFGSQSEASEHGFISVMGRRREMEDAFTAVPNLTNYETLGPGFFAVYDGHGGFGVAEKCRERLHHLVAEEMAEEAAIDWEKVMRMSFARMDGEVCDQAAGKVEGNTVGSTAVVAVVAADEIVVANCGDSRAVLCRGGVAMPLSRDHKALCQSLHYSAREARRTRESRSCRRLHRRLGWSPRARRPRHLQIHRNGPVQPNEKSRKWASPMSKFMDESNGDHCMRPYVISVPEVTVCERTQFDEFLILASDGLWDVVSNETACELVKRCLRQEQRKGRRKVSSDEANCVEGYATLAATMLAEMAISRGSKDNVSVIVVKLTPKV